jgi:hypothetical protein
MSKSTGKIVIPPPQKLEVKVGKVPTSEFKGSVPKMENPPPTPRGTKK